MVKNRSIQVRLTRDQYERIKNNARIKGFNFTSAYIRFVALKQDFVFQQKISEIHNHLLGDVKNRKHKENAAIRNRGSTSSR